MDFEWDIEILRETNFGKFCVELHSEKTDYMESLFYT